MTATVEAAVASIDAGDLAGAADIVADCLRQNPRDARALAAMGAIHLRSGRKTLAADAFAEALVYAPYRASYHMMLGSARMEGDASGPAGMAFQRACILDPGLFQAWNELGLWGDSLGFYDAAVIALQRATRIEPDHRGPWCNLGRLFFTLGCYAQAYAAFDRARGEPKIDSGVIFHVAYGDGPVDATRAVAEEWGATHAQTRAMPPMLHWDGSRKPRIGWVSADLKEHPVARNFIGLWENIGALDQTFYAQVEKFDDMSRRVAKTGEWRQINGMPDEAVARMIRQDGIDVLVFLAGHTANQPLTLAAWNAAPMQVAMGDIAPSGVPAIGWRVTDPGTHAPAEWGHEAPLMLPRFWPIEAPTTSMPTPPGPLHSSDVVTFANFGNPSKISDATLGMWLSVLRAVPSSRLLLHYWHAYVSEIAQFRFTRAAKQAGIDPARIVFGKKGLGDFSQMLMKYWDADIILDSYPFSGCTTTFEALWMGVPVITIRGERFVGRVSASIIDTAGLPRSWIATDPADFVRRAVACAQEVIAEPKAAREWRAQHVRQSSLTDGAGYAADFEHAVLTALEGLRGRRAA